LILFTTADVSAQKAEIDALVCLLYGLTAAEIKIVAGRVSVG